MKILFITILIILGFSACSKVDVYDNSYERANSASEKSLDGLDRDTK